MIVVVDVRRHAGRSGCISLCAFANRQKANGRILYVSTAELYFSRALRGWIEKSQDWQSHNHHTQQHPGQSGSDSANYLNMASKRPIPGM
jgi:hypothetical protein